MLGGRPPFTGDITQLIAQKLMQDPPPLSTLRSDISAKWTGGYACPRQDAPGDRPRLPATGSKSLRPRQRAISSREWRLACGDHGADRSEVYVDDERQGSVGRSGRVILTSVPPDNTFCVSRRSGR